MLRSPKDGTLTRSRAYTFAVWAVAAMIVLQMLTSAIGLTVASGQFERVSIDTFEYVGELTAERVSRFAEAATDVAEGTANELELVGADADRAVVEASLYQRLVREGAVRAVYVGWPDGEFLVLRRMGDGFQSQSGGGAYGNQLSNRLYDAEFALESQATEETDYDPRTRPWYSTGTATAETRWSDPYVAFDSHETLVSAAHAARESGEVTAVVGADLNLDELATVLDGIPYGDGAEAFVLTQDLKVIAAPSSHHERILAQAESSGNVARAADLGIDVDPTSVGLGTVLFTRERDMVVLDRGFSVDEGLPWRLHIVASDDDLSAGLGTLGSVVLWFNVGSLVMVTIAAIVLWRVRRPLGRLRERAMTDPLTGLLNYREFYRQGRQIARRASERGDVLTVTVLDLDEFKDLNDTHGHGVGDRCLEAAAAGLTRSARTGDLAARIGGDEFAMLHVLRADDRPLRVVQRVRDAVEHEIHVRVEGSGGVGVTAGFATSGVGADDFDALVAHADNALVAGKRVAKGRVHASGEDDIDVDRRRTAPGAEVDEGRSRSASRPR
ncbi:GGDEF domain-containing protein [Demequina muriae]|uniref:Diguanylate cyclase n=1 Tax=Demequina muriae TaxID=3051664 RepID=A0ABT8GDG9_9MICO|nr:diguanylate cyclase [Demequina sp. EGI L300058]MDN4479473.1 diguanylate cyclase [Demequina sp. EGI L300058]